MAITFNNTDNVRKIYRYSASAGTYFGICRWDTDNPAVFDYFTDTAGVGDYIVFGNTYGKWEDLTITVGTALVATSITVVWEYATSATTWSALSGVTDPSNTFQNTGTHTITFTKPLDFGNQNSPSATFLGLGGGNFNYTGTKIRCRITAVTGLTEGGANATTRPTLKDWAVKVDNAGNVTPANIQTANDAGAWGVVTTLGDTTKIDANLKIGDKVETLQNSTNAVNIQLISKTLQIGDATQRYSVVAPRNTSLTMGEIDASRRPSRGGAFIYYNQEAGNNANTGGANWYTTINAYSSLFWKVRGSANEPIISGAIDFVNSTLGGASAQYLQQLATGTWKNSTIECADNAFFYWYAGGITIDGLIFSETQGLYLGAYIVGMGLRLSNVNFSTDTYNFVLRGVNNGRNFNTLNCNFNNLETQVICGGTTMKIYVFYNLDFDFKDSDGDTLTDVNVKITDSQGNVIFNDIWSDMIEVLAYLADRDTTATTTRTNYNPFHIEVSKTGYETYTTDLTILKKEDITLTLKPALDTMLVLGKGVAIKADPTNNTQDRDLLIMN
jgi:hypothetical protein